ncbi:MAG: hypothetical protein M1814_005637 [Vezdaea aestivalis]|nr:MAG: hypothetical protein M1814_005637 [Vezdaea aestivalis]
MASCDLSRESYLRLQQLKDYLPRAPTDRKHLETAYELAYSKENDKEEAFRICRQLNSFGGLDRCEQLELQYLLADLSNGGRRYGHATQALTLSDQLLEEGTKDPVLLSWFAKESRDFRQLGTQEAMGCFDDLYYKNGRGLKEKLYQERELGASSRNRSLKKLPLSRIPTWRGKSMMLEEPPHSSVLTKAFDRRRSMQDSLVVRKNGKSRNPGLLLNLEKEKPTSTTAVRGRGRRALKELSPSFSQSIR